VTAAEVFERNLVASEASILSGFVFHIGKCGSTVLRNLLGTSDENLVLSEPPILNQLLFKSGARRLAYGAIRAMTRPFGRHRRAYVKSHALTAERMAFILDEFPNVPTAFVYRDAGEVVESVLYRGILSWVIPHLHDVHMEGDYFGMTEHEIKRLSRDDYVCRVVEGMYRIVGDLAEARSQVVLLNYSQIRDREAMANVLGHLGSDQRLVAAFDFDRYSKGETNRDLSIASAPFFDHVKPGITVSHSKGQGVRRGDDVQRLIERGPQQAYERLERIRRARSLDRAKSATCF
jgi:hypothetical protein